MAEARLTPCSSALLPASCWVSGKEEGDLAGMYRTLEKVGLPHMYPLSARCWAEGWVELWLAGLHLLYLLLVTSCPLAGGLLLHSSLPCDMGPLLCIALPEGKSS